MASLERRTAVRVYVPVSLAGAAALQQLQAAQATRQAPYGYRLGAHQVPLCCQPLELVPAVPRLVPQAGPTLSRSYMFRLLYITPPTCYASYMQCLKMVLYIGPPSQLVPQVDSPVSHELLQFTDNLYTILCRTISYSDIEPFIISGDSKSAPCPSFTSWLLLHFCDMLA